MMQPYSWADWDDDGMLMARDSIRAMRDALVAFDDDWEDIPYPIREALDSLRAACRYIEALEKKQAEQEREAWNAGKPLFCKLA